jgi:hypothetical protein
MVLEVADASGHTVFTVDIQAVADVTREATG